MMRLLISEWILLRKSFFAWFCLVLLALCSGAQMLSAYLLVKLGYISMEVAASPLRIPNFLFLYVLPSNITFGIPLIIFLSSITMGGGYTWSTIRWPIEAGFSRNQIVLGKTISLTLVGMIGALVNIMLGCVLGLLVNHWLGIAIRGELNLNVIGATILGFLITILSFWAYITIITMLVILSRSALFALCIGLLLFLLEYLLSQVVMPGAGPWDLLRPFSLLGNIYGLIKPQSSITMPGANLLALFAVIVHSFIWICVAQFFFQRQDINS
jgi:hypothetical protein